MLVFKTAENVILYFLLSEIGILSLLKPSGINRSIKSVLIHKLIIFFTRNLLFQMWYFELQLDYVESKDLLAFCSSFCSC